MRIKRLIPRIRKKTGDFCLFYTPAIAGKTPERIVSLAPSITEILYTLDLGDRLVGVTTYCYYPEEAKKKPKNISVIMALHDINMALQFEKVMLVKDGKMLGIGALKWF